MNGFNRSPGATAQPMTARNLMGQIDGTRNPKPSEPDFDKRIFVPASGPGDPALDGGRLVRRRTPHPDAARRLGASSRSSEQEQVIGRRKSDGAPLTGGTETTAMDLDKTDADGKLVIPINAHARITRPDQNGGAAMLRRPFSFHDGIDADGAPGRRAALRLLAGRPAARLRPRAAQARPGRRAVAVHPARVERAVRGAGRARRRASTWGSGCWRGEQLTASPPVVAGQRVARAGPLG